MHTVTNERLNLTLLMVQWNCEIVVCLAISLLYRFTRTNVYICCVVSGNCIVYTIHLSSYTCNCINVQLALGTVRYVIVMNCLMYALFQTPLYVHNGESSGNTWLVNHQCCYRSKGARVLAKMTVSTKKKTPLSIFFCWCMSGT